MTYNVAKLLACQLPSGAHANLATSLNQKSSHGIVLVLSNTAHCTGSKLIDRGISILILVYNLVTKFGSHASSVTASGGSPKQQVAVKIMGTSLPVMV